MRKVDVHPADKHINQSRAETVEMRFPKEFRECFKPVWTLFNVPGLKEKMKKNKTFADAIRYMWEDE